MTESIQAIVLDIDGTLLNSKHELSAHTEKVLKAAMDRGVKVILATGKTRFSANFIHDRLALNTPGIYMQGLAIYDTQGAIKHQQTLDASLARRVITFAEDRGYYVVAYCGNRLLTRTMIPRIEELGTKYHEPMPEAVGPLQNILGDIPFNKLVVVKPDDPARIKALRWQLEKQLDGEARLMQAMVLDMLEVLPVGASKGAALKVLLKSLSIDPAHVLAVGDGENDIEMIQLAGIGVAVGNAEEKLKAVADHVVGTNDADGVAEAVERFVLGGKLEEPKAAEAITPAPEVSTTDIKTDATTPEANASASTDAPASSEASAEANVPATEDKAE